MPRVIAEIDTKGQIRLEGEGFQGKSCAGIMDRLAAAMGANPDNLDRTWHQDALEAASEQVAGG